MVELFLLQHLVAFAQSGSLSRAAKELGLSQPALSRSMKRLEQEFGIPLFARSKSKIALNEAGKLAAQYARQLLKLEEEMLEQTRLFERSQRTLSLGSCAVLPFNRLLPLLQEQFGGMTIACEIAEADKLVAGLKGGAYHLAILPGRPDDGQLYCRHYLDEHLMITLPSSHPLASRREVSFQDLYGVPILAHSGSGIWLEICRQNLPATNLLIQRGMDSLHELVAFSGLPVFNSDLAVSDRVTIPITDRQASVSYFLCCLQGEEERYSALFSTACKGASGI